MTIQIGPYTQSAEAKEAYDARLKRLMDCVHHKRPDRLPTSLMSVAWLAKYGGITIRQLMYDYEKTKELAVRACEEFEPDTVAPFITLATIGPLLEAMEFRQVEWPGHGVGDNQPYQYLDREYMTADEYDDFLSDPTAYYYAKYLPRVAGAYDGLQSLGNVAGNAYVGLGFGAVAFATPEFQASLEKLKRTGQEAMRLLQHHADLVQRLAARGFPTTFDVPSTTPYDLIGDMFRGGTRMMKDMFRHKDKVLATVEKIGALMLSQTLAQAKMSANPVVFIATHWGPDPFMSPKQFETFYWPYFRKYLIGLIDAGLIPLVLWESVCTRRLETIRDVPPGKCIYWFESTDLVHAHEVLGEVVAIKGNVPASVLATGTPEEVDLQVRKLVDGIWNKGGTFILDGAAGTPEEAPVENVRAMFSAARKYGG